MNRNSNRRIHPIAEEDWLSPKKHRKEDKVIQIGNHVEPKGFDNPQCGRVYSTLGVSPTVNTCGGGDRQPKILLIKNNKLKNIIDEKRRYSKKDTN